MYLLISSFSSTRKNPEAKINIITIIEVIIYLKTFIYIL